MNNCFLLNLEEKFGTDLSFVFEKNAPLIPKHDITESKDRLLYNQLNC